MTLPAPFEAPYFNNPWKLFRNASGEDIPPFSILRITGTENFKGAIRFIVGKPNSTQETVYLVNGPETVRTAKDGRCTTLTQADYLAYDTADGTPAVGDSYGAQDGEWTAKKDVAGFFITGGEIFTAGVNAVGAIQFSSGGGEEVGIVAAQADMMYEAGNPSNDVDTLVGTSQIINFEANLDDDDSKGHVSFEDDGTGQFLFVAEFDLLVQYWITARVRYEESMGAPAQGDGGRAQFAVAGGSFNDDYCGEAIATVAKDFPSDAYIGAAASGFFRVHATESFFFVGSYITDVGGTDDLYLDDFVVTFQTRIVPFA